jgi:iron complex transport system ATP-binding protein
LVELKIQGVSCRYDSRQVLSRLEFSVRSGEVLGILGPNGSGKTTLLKTINGILRPVMGTILIDSVDIDSMKPIDVARKVAVVPQDGFANLNLTALEIVLVGRNPFLAPLQAESDRDTEMARRAMTTTGCFHLSNRRFDQLSGGERRRVILARALAQEPRILLLDEPTMNLDVNNQIELMESIIQLSREGRITVLSVFHDLNLAARYSDHILLLKQGKVFSLGSPEEVLTRENLRKVFGVETEVTKHPTTRLVITVLSSLSSTNEERLLPGSPINSNA